MSPQTLLKSKFNYYHHFKDEEIKVQSSSNILKIIWQCKQEVREGPRSETMMSEYTLPLKT